MERAPAKDNRSENHLHRLFPSGFEPHCEREASCTVFIMKINFHSPYVNIPDGIPIYKILKLTVFGKVVVVGGKKLSLKACV